MVAPHGTALWLDVNFLELVNTSDIVPDVVLGLLAVASIVSWTLIISKWLMLRGAQSSNRKFLRAFRKATRLDAVAAASEQFKAAPLVGVFDFGYSEVCRQMAAKSRAWDWSQPCTSFPVLNVSSTGQRRPAMVMK